MKDAIDKTGLKDAVRTGVGKSKGKDLVVCCMDFAFIGGSMGAVVGEKIARGIDHSIKNNSSFCDDIQIRWCSYDGSGVLVDAVG